MAKAFGRHRLVVDLRPDDFAKLRIELGRGRGPVTLGCRVQHVRTLFKYGYEAALLDKPMRFGPEFVKPSAKVVRLAGYERGGKII